MAANQFFTPLYLTLSVMDLGRSQAELENFSDSVLQVIKRSGATAQATNQGLISLIKGLESGKLRSEELRVVLELLPGVVDVIAKDLGVTRGQLRGLGGEDKITADIILDAFKSHYERSN